MIDEEKQDPDRSDDNWLRDHLAIVPIGTLVVTWFLVAVPSWDWQWWNGEGLVRIGQVAPFGAAVYGTGMFLWEKFVGLFWDQITRKGAIKKAKKAAEAMGHARGHEEGRQLGYEEGLRQGRQERTPTIAV